MPLLVTWTNSLLLFFQSFSIFDGWYFGLYALCILLSVTAREKEIPGLIFLRLVLYTGYLTEIAAKLLSFYHRNDNDAYNIYIPWEYTLMVLFYARNLPDRRWYPVLYSSIAAYVSFCTFYVCKYQDGGFPDVIYQVSCALQTAWVVILFFNMSYAHHLPLTRHPMFWIYTALLIFYSCVFYFNVAYGYYWGNKQEDIAMQLRTYINNGLNYAFYLLLSYAFICSRKMKKYY